MSKLSINNIIIINIFIYLKLFLMFFKNYSFYKYNIYIIDLNIIKKELKI